MSLGYESFCLFLFAVFILFIKLKYWVNTIDIAPKLQTPFSVFRFSFFPFVLSLLFSFAYESYWCSSSEYSIKIIEKSNLIDSAFFFRNSSVISTGYSLKLHIQYSLLWLIGLHVYFHLANFSIVPASCWLIFRFTQKFSGSQ